MGIIMTNCCKNEYTNTELLTSSSLLTNNSFKDGDVLKKIPEINNSSEGIDYLTSKDCYQILIRKIPKFIFTKKLCQKLEPKEIFYFIKQSINWIFSASSEKNDKIIKKYIEMIKNYTEYGTKKILDDLENINIYKIIKKEDYIVLIQSLSDWIMLIELILFLNKSNDNKNKGSKYNYKNLCTVYDINLWYDKNMEEIIKRYCFDGCYFLLQIKIKYKNEKYDYNKFVQTTFNVKVNNNTKNEIKKNFLLTEDFIKQISQEV